MSTTTAAVSAFEDSTPDGAGQERFGWALGMLVRAYHATVGSVLGDFPHGPRGYHALATVADCEQPSQIALAAHLGIDRTVMTYLIDDLVQAGLVERRLDPSDRRHRKIVATRKGLDVLADVEQRVRHAEDHLLDALDDEERETFRLLLRRVACHVRDIDPTTDPCDVATDVLAAD